MFVQKNVLLVHWILQTPGRRGRVTCVFCGYGNSNLFSMGDKVRQVENAARKYRNQRKPSRGAENERKMCQNKRATRRMINDIILHIYQESYVFNNCNQVFHLLSRFCRSNAVRTQCVPHILDHHISMKNMSRSRVRRLPIAVSGMYVRVSR